MECHNETPFIGNLKISFFKNGRQEDKTGPV
jgi:hypothetical protein